MPDDTRKLLWKADELGAGARRRRSASTRTRTCCAPGCRASPGCSARMSRWGASRRARNRPPTTPTWSEEEWVYILSGRGLADIDGKQWRSGRVTSWVFRRRDRASAAQPV